MKSCPVCRSQYTDPTLRFCLQDGAALAEAPQSAVETIAFSRQATVEKIQPTAEMQFFAPPVEPARNSPPVVKVRSRLALLVVAPLLLVVAAGAAAGWFYFQSQNKAVTARALDNAAPEKTSAPAAPEKTAAPPAADVSGADVAAFKKEIEAAVEAWKTATEARDADRLAAFYADKIAYYDRAAASRSDVRAEARTLFAAYDEIELALSNLRVAADAEGKTATAIFDKEWSYEKADGLVEGKAHTKLELQKIDGAWKIAGERHLKVYYLQK